MGSPPVSRSSTASTCGRWAGHGLQPGRAHQRRRVRPHRGTGRQDVWERGAPDEGHMTAVAGKPNRGGDEDSGEGGNEDDVPPRGLAPAERVWNLVPDEMDDV